MKRSETLKILKDALVDTCEVSCLIHPESLDFVLTQLEQAGMKPPVEKRCPVLLRTEHVWEKESVQNEQNPGS